MKPLLPFLGVGAVYVMSALAPALAVAQSDYPARPLRIVVPFPAGGSNDMLARYFGERLTDRLGQNCVIDNRGGANGIIGTEMVANAQADGYTLLMISASYTMNAAVRTLPYDVVKSFDPIAMLGTSPNTLAVYPNSGFHTLHDIVTRAKANPGTLHYASTGVGGFNHFGGELFKKMAGIDLVHVPYKGGGPAMIDLMAGQIPMMFSSLTQVLPHVRNDRLKLIAVGAARRNPVVPDVPTFAESGYPGYEVQAWWGISAPAGVPKAVMKKLVQVFTGILAEPETRRRLDMEAAQARHAVTEALRKIIVEEVAKWRAVAQAAGIKVQ